MDTHTHANRLYNTRSLIYAPRVTNDHWEASSSSRNASSVSSVSNRTFFLSLGTTIHLLRILYFYRLEHFSLFTEAFPLSCPSLFRQRLLLLWFLLWNERVDTIIFCIHVIPSNPVLPYSRTFWIWPERCSNNQKCKRFISVRSPNLMALPCVLPQYL